MKLDLEKIHERGKKVEKSEPGSIKKEKEVNIEVLNTDLTEMNMVTSNSYLNKLLFSRQPVTNLQNQGSSKIERISTKTELNPNKTALSKKFRDENSISI
jgi:hypothetical protein